jgi:hypothetical protein
MHCVNTVKRGSRKLGGEDNGGDGDRGPEPSSASGSSSDKWKGTPGDGASSAASALATASTANKEDSSVMTLSPSKLAEAGAGAGVVARGLRGESMFKISVEQVRKYDLYYHIVHCVVLTELLVYHHVVIWAGILNFIAYGLFPANTPY